MQCFINATHSRTHDYHILGRVYSNMGTLCHLAEEYPLSYDMYERCSEMFLRNRDSLLYYYGLNEMAFIRAEQGDKEKTLFLLDDITRKCSENQVLNAVWGTKAIMYKNVERYDSAIYFANKIKRYEAYKSLYHIIKAQSFSRLGITDSAIAYANLVLSDPLSSYQNKFNALYIISHKDSTLTKDSIRNIASRREDIRYYEYEPNKEKLTKAVQLLEQDLHRKPDMRWLYAVIVTVGVIGLSLFVYIRRKRKQHQLLTQQINELEGLNEAAKQNHERMVQEHNAYTENIEEQIENQCAVLRQSSTFRKDVSWKDFDKMCSVINNQLFFLANKLKQLDVLSEKEIRLCILIVIDFSYKEIAEILPYSLSGLGKFKYSTAKKLSSDTKNMRRMLIKIAIGE